MKQSPQDWQRKLSSLKQVNWERTAEHWQSRVIFGRKIAKDRTAVLGVVSHLKACLKLPRTGEEDAFEQGWRSLNF